jgi:hypothetical protein
MQQATKRRPSFYLGTGWLCALLAIEMNISMKFESFSGDEVVYGFWCNNSKPG